MHLYKHSEINGSINILNDEFKVVKGVVQWKKAGLVYTKFYLHISRNTVKVKVLKCYRLVENKNSLCLLLENFSKGVDMCGVLKSKQINQVDWEREATLERTSGTVIPLGETIGRQNN